MSLQITFFFPKKNPTGHKENVKKIPVCNNDKICYPVKAFAYTDMGDTQNFTNTEAEKVIEE